MLVYLQYIHKGAHDGGGLTNIVIRPPTLVRCHISERTTNHKVEVASVLTSQENIILLFQWIFESHELGQEINLQQLKETFQQLTQESATPFPKGIHRML